MLHLPVLMLVSAAHKPFEFFFGLSASVLHLCDAPSGSGRCAPLTNCGLLLVEFWFFIPNNFVAFCLCLPTARVTAV